MTRRRIAWGALVAVLATTAIVAGVTLGREDPYTIRAEFRNANGLIKGYSVRIGGAPVGKVTSLELNKRDHVVVEMSLDPNAGAVGRDAKLTVKNVDLFGEKFVALDPGDIRHPAPSGAMIPPQRTGVSVDMDDIINSVGTSTRDALTVFLDASGTALLGRGRDLGTLLRTLPPSLDSTGRLLGDLGQDNRALGRLVEESDRVVGSVARERAPLGRLVDNAGTTFDTLARRRTRLGETVSRAPATLTSARRALATLQGAAIPLTPAARGLRATAPELTTALRALPGFASAARPTLRTARDVAPALGRLGRRGTPTVRRLRPLTAQLSAFAGDFDPAARILDEGFPNQLALMEGWARSTQGHDVASQVFRFGARGVDDSSAFATFLAQLTKDKTGVTVPDLPAGSVTTSSRAPAPAPRRAGGLRPPARPPAAGDRGGAPPEPPQGANNGLLDYLLGP